MAQQPEEWKWKVSAGAVTTKTYIVNSTTVMSVLVGRYGENKGMKLGTKQ